jgi:hypothetical protein
MALKNIVQHIINQKTAQHKHKGATIMNLCMGSYITITKTTKPSTIVTDRNETE